MDVSERRALASGTANATLEQMTSPDAAIRITTMSLGANGVLWLGTADRGLGRFHNGKLDFRSASDGHSQSEIATLLPDNEGSLWAGTRGSGLFRFRDLLAKTVPGAAGVSRTIAWAVAETKDGSIWVGSDDGLTRFQNGKARTYTVHDGLAHRVVNTLAAAPDGSLWIGTPAGRYTIWRDGKFTTHTFPAGDTGSIRYVHASRDGSIWFATNRGTRRIVNGRVEVLNKAAGLPTDITRSITEDRQGRIWISTARGLAVWQDGQLRRSYTTSDGLLSASIRSVSEGADGTIWVTTQAGLHRLSGNRFKGYSSAQGLPDDDPYAAFDDGRGHLWVTSAQGIWAIRLHEFDLLDKGEIPAIPVRVVGRTDGMLSASCVGSIQPAARMIQNRDLWAPTLSGVAVIDVNRLISEPELVTGIDEVTVDREAAGAGPGFVVKPGSRELTIHYSAINLRSPEGTEFRYKLVGFDRTWVPAQRRRFAYYTNVPPGSYTFQACSRSHNGPWCSRCASISIEVQPWWYETGAFRASASGCSFLCSWAD